MFSRPGCWLMSAGDRYASDPPMSTVPAAASEMPVPEPVPDVLTTTFGLSVPYATCHALTSGRSSVLPVSDTVVPPPDD